MYTVTQQQFEDAITVALDELPQEYIKRLNNVAIVTADNPSEAERQQLHLHNGQTLYGLYQGIPMTLRGSNYNLVLPDKITLYKEPMEMSSNSLADLKAQVKHTLWHEIAHFFGLNHDRIYKLDGTKKDPQ